MKKIQIIAARMTKNNGNDFDSPRATYTNRFKIGESAQKWVNKIMKEITGNCGNGWPVKILVDGEECVHSKDVEFMF